MSADGYVSEINSLKQEIARLNAHLAKLRHQKKEAEKHLYNYMSRHGIEKLHGISIGSIKPRASTRKPVKPKKERKQEAIELFREVGIPDPVAFWQDFERTQRYSGDSVGGVY